MMGGPGTSMNHFNAQEWLVCCLRPDSDQQMTSKLGQLSDPEWEDLIHQAIRHLVSPLLYLRLNGSPARSSVPDWVRHRLRLLYLKNGGRNTHLYHELGKVLESFRKNHIPVIALKGAHLAEKIYGNIALRPMNDLDLLVRKEDLKNLEGPLLKLGYHPISQRKQDTGEYHHLVYQLPEKEITLEIHWDLIGSRYPFHVDMDGQWKRARPSIIGGVEILVQCPEDLLLHLCLHTTRDLLFETGLKPLWDLYETIRHYEKTIDWNQVLLRSRQWGIENAVYLILNLTKEILGASVPEEVLKNIRPADFNHSFTQLAKDQIFAPRQSPGSLFLSINIARLWRSRGLPEKVALFLKRTFPSKEEMTWIYPSASGSPWIYLYYPLRLKELFIRYSRPIWRLLCHDQEMKTLAEQKYKLTPLKEWLKWPD